MEGCRKRNITGAEDVVIGSGGQMLARFVQAMVFARSCKDLIRMNLVLDAWFKPMYFSKQLVSQSS